MAEHPDLEAGGDASEALELEPVASGRPNKRRGLIAILLIIVLFGAGGWAGWNYLAEKLYIDDPYDVPIVRANPAPIKVRPESPGGMEVPDRDKLVYDRMAGEREAPTMERLLPPPESPLPPPAPPPPAAPPAPPLAVPAAPVPTSAEAVPTAPPPPPATPVPSSAEAAPTSPALPPAATSPALPPAAPGPSSAEAAAGSTPPVPVRSSAAPPEDKPASPPPVAAPAAPAPADVIAARPPAAPESRRTAAPETRRTAAPESKIPAPRESRKPSLPKGTYKVQLAAVRSAELVKGEWDRLRRRNRDLLGGLELTVTRADLGPGKGVYYRLRAGPIADEAAARALCASLAQRRFGCLVVRPDG